MVRLAGCGCTGTYFLRNLQLRRVTLPEPSMCVTYWSNWRTSMTTPVLSHLVGLGPDWFWIRTWLPTAKGGSVLVCSDHLSPAFMCLFLRASCQPRWLSGMRHSRVHSLMIARRSLCPEKLGSNPGQGSKGINFSGWHGLDISITVTKRR